MHTLNEATREAQCHSPAQIHQVSEDRADTTKEMEKENGKMRSGTPVANLAH